MTEEEKSLNRPEIGLKFHEYLQDLYTILLENDISDEKRKSEALKVLTTIEDNIPENEYCWTDEVPNNLMFILLDKLLFLQINVDVLLRRGEFQLNYFTEKLIPSILNRPYLDLLQLIPDGEFSEEGKLYTTYTLISMSRYDLVRQVISQMTDYRFRAMCLIKMAEALIQKQKCSEVENIVYEIITEGNQAETYLERTMTSVEATKIMVQCNTEVAKILINQAIPEVLNIQNLWNRNEQLVKLVRNYARIREVKKAENVIDKITDPYFICKALIAIVDYNYCTGSNKSAQPMIKNILRQSRKVETFFKMEIAEELMVCLIRNRFYGDVFYFLPHFIQDQTLIASLYVSLAQKVNVSPHRLDFLQRACKRGSPNEETCLKIIEMYVNGGLFDLVNPVFIRLNDPYFICQAQCILAVGHFEYGDSRNLKSYLASAVDRLDEVSDPRKRFELWLVSIETHYVVGELPPVWGMIEKAVGEFNQFEVDEWRCLLDRYIPLVTRIRDVKWAFQIAASIQNCEKRMYFVNRVVETVGITGLNPGVLKLYLECVFNQE
jgi:hypothetical protein